MKEIVDQNEAKRLLHQHRIEKLLVVDPAGNCVGLITVKDIEKSQLNPNATKDAQGRLRAAAATSVGEDGFERAERLIDAGVDLLVIDTAHGHSQRVLDAVTRAKKLSNSVRIIAGNVATADGTKALIDAGADARQGRYRSGLDLHHAHRCRCRRSAALGHHVGGRGRAEGWRVGHCRWRHQISPVISPRRWPQAQVLR